MLRNKMKYFNSGRVVLNIAELPAKLDFSASKEVGPFGLLWASSNKEVKKGLGVLLELTKGLGNLKSVAGAGNDHG